MRFGCFAVTFGLLFVAYAAPVNASGHFREFHVDTRYGGISGIAKGPDGNLWFTNMGIGRISPTGVVKQMAIGLSSNANGLTTGADGNLWFLEQHKVGKITPSGRVTEYDVRSTYPYSYLTPSYGITLGPDGNVWFTEYWNIKIGRVTPQGVITEFAIPGNGYNNPSGIAAGPDGNLWFAQNTRYSGLNDMTIGPDGNVWFTEMNFNDLGVYVF